MTQPTHLLECLKCGFQLEHHAGLPDSAPWWCRNCYHGFWIAELSADARARYKGGHDFGHGPEAIALRLAVERERDAARERGTSALAEHLGFLDKEHLKFMAERFPLSKEFKKKVEGALNG